MTVLYSGSIHDPYDLGKAIADRTEVKSIVNLRIVGTQWKGMKQMVLSDSKQTSGADLVLNLKHEYDIHTWKYFRNGQSLNVPSSFFGGLVL